MTSLTNGFLKPEWDAPLSIQTLVTKRTGGVSLAPFDSFNLGDHVGDLPENVLANRARLRTYLPADPIWLKQIHGVKVSTPSTRLLEADAVVTNIPNEVLAIMTADCLPAPSTAGAVCAKPEAGKAAIRPAVMAARTSLRMTSPLKLSC